MGLAIVDKRRQKANVSEVMNVIGDVAGKTCILFDDMVDTAGSLCNAANALVEIGGAKEVYACATHGVLSGPAFERINSSVIKELVVHNTIPLPENCPSNKISQLDVAPIFARAIAHIHGGTSIADLF
jgi:ribose-phosphate pyrophosphokinase